MVPCSPSPWPGCSSGPPHLLLALLLTLSNCFWALFHLPFCPVSTQPFPHFQHPWPSRPQGHWPAGGLGGARGEPHELPHLEGQDEDDARNGGHADEPAPPDGGDNHRGQADDEQGARQPEHLGRWETKPSSPTCSTLPVSGATPSSLLPPDDGEVEEGL